MQKAGIRWAGCSGGDTQQPPPPPASLLYTAANMEIEQQFSGQCDLVLIGNRGNLRLLLSASTVPVWRWWCNHPCSYAKQLCCILFPLPSALGTVPSPACRLFNIAVLAPFHNWGLCWSQPADYLIWLCSCQVLIGFSYSTLHTDLYHFPSLWKISFNISSNIDILAKKLKFCLSEKLLFFLYFFSPMFLLW
jgi:hypothetical protein